MKRIVDFVLMLLMLFAFVSCSPENTASGQEKNWKVGDAGTGGGYIFYDVDADNDEEENDGLTSKDLGWRYIQAATEDIDVITAWGQRKTDLQTEEGIGKGYSNTRKIYDATTGYTNAATEVWNITIDGGGGWFVPSKDELALMYENLHKADLGSFSSEGTSAEEYCYWSSTEYDTASGWFLGFDRGIADGAKRWAEFKVRPVRYLKADGEAYVMASDAEPYIFYDVDADNDVEYTDENGAKKKNADGLTSSELGWRYLQAATEDIKGVCWGPSGDSLSTSTAVGTGYANTKKIYDADDETESYMATRVWNQTIDGGEGWFIPSYGELALIYTELALEDKGALTENGDYWSSSESSTSGYCIFYGFYDAENYPGGYGEEPSQAMIVRPVRYLTADKEVYIPTT